MSFSHFCPSDSLPIPGVVVREQLTGGGRLLDRVHPLHPSSAQGFMELYKGKEGLSFWEF